MDRRTWIIVVAAALFGLALRTADLTGTSFTHDEAYSMWVVDDAARFWARLPTDGHPPLWYGLLAAWTRIAGESDLAGRLSSAFAIVALAPVAALAAMRLFDARTARWAAVLVAVWPMLVAEQRDVRMYAWLPVLASAALLLLARARERNGRGDWVVAGIALAALGATHHFGAVVAAGLVLATALEPAARRGLALAAAVAAVLYAPVAILLVFLVRGYPAGASRGIGPGSILQLVTGLTVGPLDLTDPAILLGGSALVLVAAGIGLRRSGPAARLVGVPLAFGTVVPIVLAAAVFAFPPAPRYFTAVIPFLTLLVARFAATARTPGPRVYAVAVAAILVVGSIWTITTARALDADWRGLAARVMRETRDETAVYVAPAYFTLAYQRYATSATPIRAVPDVVAAPPEFPRPTMAELRAAIDANEPHWLLIPDWLLADEPEIASLLDARGVALSTGWWMRAYRLTPR